MRGIVGRELRKKGAEEGKTTRRFLDSVTHKGYLCFFDTARELCPRLYVLEDQRHVAGPLLRQAHQAALSAGGLTMSAAVTYVDTQDTSLHGRVAAQSPAADTQVVQGAQVTLSIYRVESMLARSSVTLDLPQSDSLTSVRITLVQGDTEVTVYQGEYPANASRHPEVELTAQDPGDYIYKVYFGDKFAYQQQVTLQ